MTDLDIRRKIETTLKSFSSGNFSNNALVLFGALGYNTDRQAPLDKPDYANFKETFFVSQSKFNEDKALVKDWQYVDLLFQLSKEEIRKQISLFDTQKIDRTIIETYLFFAIALSKDQYSRTELSNITREINRLFPMPVMILFKHGQCLTLSVINRRQHKRDENKDVLEKITLIKDIKIENPHRAHVEILFDLSFDKLQINYGFTNFVELHNAWQKTLDTKELNKRFYLELSNWYFWAMDHVSFPDDVEKDKTIRNATSLIRLITRIIFIWFIKEKSLVPDVLFDRREMGRILKAFEKNKKPDSYYRAILQNLFFGTLNQQMNERGFAKEGTFLENKSNYGVKNLFRYAGDFAIAEKEVLALFKDIPFLNGGLFDCLDKENDEDKVVYGDGFSRNPKKQAVVPDNLFFGEETEYDLNAIYGTKNKRYKIKGLFNILSAYKFTVAENTPVEEEIALDPELLGRVFENLLASYNPETQTTARKQTGSFYTPREIVNYMVDESLKAYLQQKLEDETGIKPEDAEAGLEILFTYTEKEHAFTARETKALIAAIDNCKILDPACGSGAFPMGVLHKLVHILHKLDPHNEKWKERQISRARQLDDPAIREKTIEDIESAFANNELDYGRKLYLIENCIYGVDIQPIAVQIAKLRFFISLIVDQKKQAAKKNLGIRSLPNLETKFVAANTLIGLEKPQTLGNAQSSSASQVSLRNPEIEQLEKELKDLRHQYFNAGTRREKLACQKKDRDLRKKIAGLLEKDGWNKDAARSVAAFDPYDQNASSPFFDPEWMFGVTEGFDVVIANPPYVQMQKDGGKLASELKNQNYLTWERTGDLYAIFYEHGLNILRENGTETFITSSQWMKSNYGKSLRKFFLSKNPLKLILLGPGIFESATVDTNILTIQNTNYKNQLNGGIVTQSDQLTDLANLQLHAMSYLSEDAWTVMNASKQTINEKINSKGKPLSEWKVNIYFGIKTGYNEAFIIDEAKRKELVNSDSKCDEIIRPILKGREINKYVSNWENDYIIFIPWHYPLHNDSEIVGASELAEKKFSKNHKSLYEYFESHKEGLLKRNRAETAIRYEWYALQRCAATYKGEFSKEKVIWKRIGSQLRFSYSNSEIYCLDSTCIATGEKIKYLTALLNSKLCNYQLFENAPKTGMGDLIISVQALEPLHVYYPNDNEEMIFNYFIDLILHLKKHKKTSSFFEQLIDAMVYELYFPEEIKVAGAEVLKYLTNIHEFKEEWSDLKKLEVIEKVYKELSNPNHPVSIAMFKMDTIEEIRIIEGKQ